MENINCEYSTLNKNVLRILNEYAAIVSINFCLSFLKLQVVFVWRLSSVESFYFWTRKRQLYSKFIIILNDFSDKKNNKNLFAYYGGVLHTRRIQPEPIDYGLMDRNKWHFIGKL